MTTARGIVAAAVTEFDELNTLLVELTERAAGILDASFVGAYVQGSFALGAGDIHSDCDFLVVTDAALTSVQEAQLRELHDEIPTRDGHWTHHLEGSYPVASELRSVEAVDREWLFVDHGWREMQWDTHCNTEVVRWILRERGITLVGPEPAHLVEPVPPEALRARMRELIPGCLEQIATWVSLDIAWAQRYAVTTLARMLYTLQTAEVASKPAALEWAHDALDPTWRPLIEQVIADRTLGFDADAKPRPGTVDQTRAFAAYVTSVAAVR